MSANRGCFSSVISLMVVSEFEDLRRLARLTSAIRMGDFDRVKTMLEIPDSLFRKLKATAARQGQTPAQIVQEALREKFARTEGAKVEAKPWMALAGGLKHLHEENLRIDRLIEAEFENSEPEDR
jgi:predicted transcriptional regulator